MKSLFEAYLHNKPESIADGHHKFATDKEFSPLAVCLHHTELKTSLTPIILG